MQEVAVRAIACLAATALIGGIASQHGSAAQQPDGAKVYANVCAACHQATGLGLDSADKHYPPLAGSEWVTGSEERLVRIILHGLNGEIEVMGETFSGAMPTWGTTLGDADLAAVASYVRRSWGNKAAPIATATVTRLRLQHADRKTPWTVEELRKASALRPRSLQ